MAHDVFISHSAKDKAVADAACARLEQAGYRCWIAPRDVSGEWAKAIVEAIRGARVFVLIFSREANLSPQVNREVERAVSNGLPIVPLRIEDVTPSDALEYFISNQHWLDALTPPLARHLDRLAEMVGRLLAPDRQPVVIAPPRDARTQASPNWPLWIASAIVLASLSGGALFWLSRDSELPDSANNLAIDPPDTDGNGARPVLAEPPPLRSLLDFGRVPISTAPNGLVEAAPYLASADPAVTTSASPASARLVFLDRRNLIYEAAGFGGYQEIERSERTLLVLQRQGSDPAFLTLRFANPIAEVRLILPRLNPRRGPLPGQYGTVFPAMVASAVDANGQVIAERSYPQLEASSLSEPRQTIIALRAPGAEGIRALQLRIDGLVTTTDTTAYAAARARGVNDPPPPPPPPPPFNAMLIVEEILVRIMPAPAG